MKMGSIRSRKLGILGALLFATLVTACYGPGWGGGSAWWGLAEPGYYYGGGGGYLHNYYYRGWGGLRDDASGRSVFAGYAPAQDAWNASSRGRASLGGGVSGDGHGS